MIWKLRIWPSAYIAGSKRHERASCCIDRSLVGRAANACPSGRLDGSVPGMRGSEFTRTWRGNGLCARDSILAARRRRCRRRVLVRGEGARTAARVGGNSVDSIVVEAAVCAANAARRSVGRRASADTRR